MRTTSDELIKSADQSRAVTLKAILAHPAKLKAHTLPDGSCMGFTAGELATGVPEPLGTAYLARQASIADALEQAIRLTMDAAEDPTRLEERRRIVADNWRVTASHTAKPTTITGPERGQDGDQ